MYSNILIRVIAASAVVILFLFLIDNTLIFWLDWPGIKHFVFHLGGLEIKGKVQTLDGSELTLGWVQFSVSLGVLLGIIRLTIKTSSRTLDQDAAIYSCMTAYIVRAAFWSVFLVGIADMLISFVRVEGFLNAIVSDHLTIQLGRPIFRGSYIHFPLILFSFVIAYFSRSLGFIWLALLIVAAEFLIVITRFVFSYEQAFMGDLVRFWYAGLFLFASAYTLLEDGHVRVDVLYANFSKKGKAITNIFGSILLGLPLCWNILIQGMAGKGSVINSPLLSFEISQSGFGMFTKYLMAGYLIIFAVSMTIQFISFALSNIAIYQSSHQNSQLDTNLTHSSTA